MHTHPYLALNIAGTIFGLVAMMHLLRLIYKTPIIIAGKIIPLWISYIGFILPLALSIWMLFESYSNLALAGGEKMGLTIQSLAFNEGHSIPIKYTCDGENISPPLSWKDEPKNTKSFVLIVEDPDALAGNWDHWIVFNIPEATHNFSENLTSPPTGAKYGKNSWGNASYSGPCPPQGEHRYLFNLYALDVILNLSSNANKLQIESAMQGHILAATKLLGKYKKY